MKRTRILAVTLLLVATAPVMSQTASTHPFYPLNIGDRWTYRVIDLKSPKTKLDSKKKVEVEVERQEPYMRKNEKDPKAPAETKIGFILKSTSGGKTTRDHVIVLDNGIHRIHAAGTPITPPLLFFKAPLNKGDKWECNSTSGNTTIKGMFSWKVERINVPAGAFDTVAVSFTNNKAGEDRVEIDYWFAEKVGMVKQRVREKDREIALELERYEPAK